MFPIWIIVGCYYEGEVKPTELVQLRKCNIMQYFRIQEKQFQVFIYCIYFCYCLYYYF